MEDFFDACLVRILRDILDGKIGFYLSIYRITFSYEQIKFR